jgi:hypothetical protein
MPLIEASVIPGASVYGVQQVSYTVDGAADKDFSAALAAAAFRQTTAIEAATAAYSDVVRERERKLDELGEVLAQLNKSLGKLKSTGRSSDTATVDNGAWVNGTASKYGITLVFKENTSNMTRENLMKGQNEIQYAIDTEDNNLQQDLVSLQGLLSKRDNAHSTAARIVRKADDAAGSTIGNIV